MSHATLGTLAFDDASNVTHSTAFAILDTLVDEGRLAEERSEYLKQKFRDLHRRVLTIYKRDNLLLKRARRLRTELDKERERVQSRGAIARQDNSEIQNLKQTLGESEKALAEAMERESVLQVEILEYDRRKQSLILEREDAIAAEESRLRPTLEGAQAEITELGEKVKRMASERAELQAQSERLVTEEEACKAEIANFTTTLAQAKQRLANVERDPERAHKQLQLVERGLQTAKGELAALDEKLAMQADTIARLELQQSSRLNDFAEAKATVQKLNAEMEAKQKALTTLNTSLEVELETRQSYQDRMQELEQLIAVAQSSQRQEVDALDKLQREKERCVREYTASEQSQDKLLYEEQTLKGKLTNIQRAVEHAVMNRKAIQKEVIGLQRGLQTRRKRLLLEKRHEGDFAIKAATLLDDIEDMESRLAEKIKLEEVRRRELSAVIAKRQKVNMEGVREAGRVTLVQNELRTAEIYIHEIQRRHETLEKRHAALLQHFQKIKRERNARAAEIQTITLKMTEVAEKTKILENEFSVLQRESVASEKETVVKRRRLQEVQQACASLRLEKDSKRKRLELELESERNVKARMQRMNAEITMIEDTMAGLCETYATAVTGRNQTGVQLIDRNDELSLLVEKVKAQRVAIDQGTAVINARADEVRTLRISLSNLQRDIEICQQSIPKVRQMETELAELSSALEDEQWRVQVLENDLADPNNEHRWRRLPPVLRKSLSAKLSGKSSVAPAAAAEGTAANSAAPSITDTGSVAEASLEEATTTAVEGPSPATEGGMLPLDVSAPSEEYVRLRARCQELEARVNRVDAQLREKELILAEVTELSARVGGQADAGKAFTLALAKQVNKYQGGIRQKARQMMATIAELSLFQASSLQLQQEVQRLEEVVVEAEEHLRNGEAPYAEAVEEYEREKQRTRRYAELSRQRREELTQAAAAQGGNGVVTTAAPRANMYIPDDELGLPRPYGTFAPFRPAYASTAVSNQPASLVRPFNNVSSRHPRLPNASSSGAAEHAEEHGKRLLATAPSGAIAASDGARSKRRLRSENDGSPSPSPHVRQSSTNDAEREHFSSTQ